MEKPKRHIGRLVLFSLIPVLLLLLVAECGSRLILTNSSFRERAVGWSAVLGPAQKSNAKRILRDIVPDPYSGYRLKLTGDPESRRPAGKPFPPKMAGEVRVLCMGDSVAYGICIPDEKDAWPGRLQFYLDRWAPEGVNFQVYNGGVPGYNGQKCKRLLQTYYMDLEPDIVLWGESLIFGDVPESPDKLPSLGVTLSFWLYRSHFLYLLMMMSHSNYSFDPPVHIDEKYEWNVLPKLVEWSAERGVKAFLGVDYLYCERKEDDRLELQSKKDIWDQHSFPCLPAIDYFPQDPVALEELFIDTVHFTEAGSDLYGRAISDGLRERWPELGPELGFSDAVVLPSQ